MVYDLEEEEGKETQLDVGRKGTLIRNTIHLFKYFRTPSFHNRRPTASASHVHILLRDQAGRAFPFSSSDLPMSVGTNRD